MMRAIALAGGFAFLLIVLAALLILTAGPSGRLSYHELFPGEGEADSPQEDRP